MACVWRRSQPFNGASSWRLSSLRGKSRESRFNRFLGGMAEAAAVVTCLKHFMRLAAGGIEVYIKHRRQPGNERSA